MHRYEVWTSNKTCCGFQVNHIIWTTFNKNSTLCYYSDIEEWTLVHPVDIKFVCVFYIQWLNWGVVYNLITCLMTPDSVVKVKTMKRHRLLKRPPEFSLNWRQTLKHVQWLQFPSICPYFVRPCFKCYDDINSQFQRVVPIQKMCKLLFWCECSNFNRTLANNFDATLVEQGCILKYVFYIY